MDGASALGEIDGADGAIWEGGGHSEVATNAMGRQAADSTGGKPCSFRMFSDRTASDLEAFEWNASMDLLACLTAPPDSTLSIYRLLSEEQSPKLLSEKITGIGTALAWSPCGRRIAVGDRLGGVAIYDGESGAVLHTRRLHMRPVVALSWVDANTGCDSSGEPPWSHMLPPLLAIPSAPSNMYSEMPVADIEPDVGDGFSLLASADEGGHVIVSAGGTFSLQVTHLSKCGCSPPTSSPGPSQLSASFSDALRGEQLITRRLAAVRLSPDLRCLAVLLGVPGSAPSSGHGHSSGPRSPITESPGQASTSTPEPAPRMHNFLRSPGHSVAAGGASSSNAPAIIGEQARPAVEMVLVLDVRKLAVRRRELAQCSNMAERLLTVVGYARRGVDTLGNVWRGAADGFANKMRGLAEAIEAFGDGDNASIHEELLTTCCTGIPSDAMHAFLTRQTSPQQLTRLERALSQALEYVNLVACTRLQVAGHHILTILHELHACASWTQKFKSIGLDVEPLQNLMHHAQELLRLIELLLIDCSQARRFVRTLFQVLLRMAQRLAEQPMTAAETGASAPSKEDMDDFVDRMRRRHSLELAEVTNRISANRAPPDVRMSPLTVHGGPAMAAADASTDKPQPVALSSTQEKEGSAPQTRQSLTSIIQQLGSLAEQVGEHIVVALSAHVDLLACIPIHAPSPWAAVRLPELRAAASGDLAAGVPSPRGLGGSTVSLTWEALASSNRSQLIVLWSSAGTNEAELHLCRIKIEPAPPGSAKPPALERALLRVGRLLAPLGSPSLTAHFLLCQMYDPSHAATLVLQEQPGAATGAVAAVCLVDVSELVFHNVAALVSASEGGELSVVPQATTLDDLPEGSVKKSAALPESYVWASAMRVMSTRGVCSVYAWRARRLLTLDMEAEVDEDDVNDEDVRD